MTDADSRPAGPGRGAVGVEVVRGRSTVVRCQASNPLKLLTPRRRSKAAWIYTSTFGGGLVAGDEVKLDVSVAERAICCLTTQSATKVYRSPQGEPARQELRATVSTGGVLVIVPDPVICFAEAIHEQEQFIDVSAGGTVVVLDWLTSGRRGYGEHWAFRRYLSRLNIDYDGERVLTDSLLLDQDDGPLDSPFRMGRFHCLAALVMIGDHVAETNKHTCADVNLTSVGRDDVLIESVSTIRDGAIVRMIGDTPERVAERLNRRLEFTRATLGSTPWERKW